MQLKDCSKDLDVREAMYFTHLDSLNLLPKVKKKKKHCGGEGVVGHRFVDRGSW